MISRIIKMKDVGVFRNFTWTLDIPEFKKFNLIYGWNRSGKTTLSRVFASCEKKSLYDKVRFEQFPETGEFTIETDDMPSFKSTEVPINTLPIKVFNQDFIDTNISFDSANLSNPIIYVSEEDIESKKKLHQLREDRVVQSRAFDEDKKSKREQESVKSEFLTGLAREIATNLGIDRMRYQAPNVENKINNIGIENLVTKVLSSDIKAKYEHIIRNEPGKILPEVGSCRFSLQLGDKLVEDFKKITEVIENLLGRQVISETLDRLKNNQLLNNWVKQGFDLHKADPTNDKCLFCQKPLDPDLLSTLSKHFSKDYELLQTDLARLKSELIKLKLMEFNIENEAFKFELKEKYQMVVKKANENIRQLNVWVDSVVYTIQEKHDNPLRPSKYVETPVDFYSIHNANITELNAIIKDHNNKIRNHGEEVKDSHNKLELNAIAVAISERGYKTMLVELADAVKKLNESEAVLSKTNFEITELEKKSSNIGNALNRINMYLEEFFGRREIVLALDESNKGYVITRNGKLAKNLSEGEKTAIAFSYFIVKVGEQEFDRKKGIIFIDDPISSLDSNFIYHSFSLIKNHFNDVGQLFISTHNFQFFNLVKEWMVRKNENNKKNDKDENCEFYMIRSLTNRVERESTLTSLDRTLKEHKSEYAFLFSLLTNFIEGCEEPGYEEIYNISNIGRRFFEIFADFKIPFPKKGPKEKIDAIVNAINKNKGVDDEKLSQVVSDKVFWLINSFSHNSDPTSTIEHKDKSECKEAIRILLKIVKESDPLHYLALEAGVKKNVTS